MSVKISGKFHPIPSTIANQRWISIRNIIIYLETKFCPNWRIFVFGGLFVPWLPWQRLPFWIFSIHPPPPPKAATHYGGNFYKVSWSLMKGIPIFFESPLFCFHGNCGKVCPANSDFVGLARSTRCGCWSYQVSSISVWRVTHYDHFCVFQFFNILSVSLATVAILKILKVVCTSTHSA